MPPPPHPSLPKAAQARLSDTFDPWNSSSTGHQRAEHKPGSGWRDSRNKKVNSQFRAGGSGGERLDNTSTYLGREVRDADGEMDKTGPSVVEMLTRPGVMRSSLARHNDGRRDLAEGLTGEEALKQRRRMEDEEKDGGGGSERGIFHGVVVYVNGSTFPLISDHKLKKLLTEHKGQLSLHLGRRKVTHVILGRPSTPGQGCGGGLAGGKLEKEIRKIGGSGIKFVGVEWILESLKAGKRLPEARFSNLKIAAKGQGSVYGLYAKKDAAEPETLVASKAVLP